ncbi:hypothetical protein BVRB_030660 [Beta vulgaris subsp. vulgaris]|uniref:Uncharacterized protein n=1 Tax=Beta vulgaris subsp. vulgaris TaxID=3555 RepID=A0A0J8AXI5_BETVV|nr:hypothetical protein BVRB_030660 [Beta vulgaris subsp. vulgaris]
MMYGLAQLVAPMAGGLLAGVCRIESLNIVDLPYAFLVSAVSAVLVLVTLVVCAIWLPESPAFAGRDAIGAKCVEMAVLAGKNATPLDPVQFPMHFRLNSDLLTMIVNCKATF